MEIIATGELINLLFVLAVAAAGAGFMAGLLGVGGGIVMVPALYYAFTVLDFDIVTIRDDISLEVALRYLRKIKKLPMVNDRGRLVIDFEKLSLIAKKNSWLMFVNPQNPGGTVYSKKELKNLSKIVKEKNITVFSDELHCDLILQKNLEHTPLGSIKTIEKNVVSFYSASKTFNVR